MREGERYGGGHRIRGERHRREKLEGGRRKLKKNVRAERVKGME